jgi:hypothetical protein
MQLDPETALRLVDHFTVALSALAGALASRVNIRAALAALQRRVQRVETILHLPPLPPR